MSNFFKSVKIKKLTEQHKAILDKESSLLDIKRAIDSFSKGKAPGMDWFPTELYSTFWPQINLLFREVIK